MGRALLLAGFLSLWRPAGAEACCEDDGALARTVVFSLVLGLALDMSLTITDLVAKEPSRVYGAVELLLTAPQAALLANMVAGAVAADAGSGGLVLGLAAWTGALAVHGAFTLFGRRAPPSHPDQPRQQARVQWGGAPALLSTERTPAAPGVVLFGRF